MRVYALCARFASVAVEDAETADEDTEAADPGRIQRGALRARLAAAARVISACNNQHKNTYRCEANITYRDERVG